MTDSGVGSSSTGKSVTLCTSEAVVDRKPLKRENRPHSLDLSYHSEPVYSKTSVELANAASKTNSLPLPPKRRDSRKCSLQGDEAPPRHLLGPKPARFKALSAESKLSSDSESSKLSMEITPILEVSKNAVRATREAGTVSVNKNVHKTPTLEVTKDVDRETELCTEISNDNDDNLSDVFVDDTKVVPETINDVVSCDEGQFKFTDNLSPASADADIGTEFNKVKQMKSTVDSNLELIEVEIHTNSIRNIDSDMESQKSVPVERSDTDSQVDIISESSADTVATAVEIKNLSTITDTGDVRNSTVPGEIVNAPVSRDILTLSGPREILHFSNEKLFIVHNPSFDPLQPYELLSSDRKLPVSDDSNPKLTKDMTNKISKESTHRLSKNLASEISDFFRLSASKLKPPCLDLPKRDMAPRKIKNEENAAESSFNKFPQPLVPRSPYITSVSAFEPKAVPRKSSAKQPPFYVWNINSKNAAVCKTLPPTFSYRLSVNDETKILKDFENSTKKILEWHKRTSVDNTARLLGNKTSDIVGKSASTGQLATKSQQEAKMSQSKSNERASTGQLSSKSQRDSKMSPSQSNVLNLKQKSRLFSSKSKTVTKPRSPNRLLVPKASTKEPSPTKTSPPNRKDFKISMKTLPKITIPLPSPLITVAKVKTQLPCDFKTSGTKRKISKPSNSLPQGHKLPDVVVSKPKKKERRSSLCKKWKSLMNLMLINSSSEFSGAHAHKRANTWPLIKSYYNRRDDLPKYESLK